MRYLAIDTETTGLFIKHGCKPFMIICCDQDGEITIFEAPVDPTDRSVRWSRSSLNQFYKLTEQHNTFVFLNASFDLGAINSVHKKSHDYIMSQKIDDVGVMAHVIDNETSGKLKPLGKEYLGIDDDDEKELQRIVVSARNIAKKLGWDYAVKDHPHFLLQKKSFPKNDYWLPKEVAIRHPELIRDSEEVTSSEELCSNENSWGESLNNSHRITTIEKWETGCRVYGELDGIRTAGLYRVLSNGLVKEGLTDVYYGVHKRCIKTIYQMERRGLPLLPRSLSRLLRRYKRELKLNESFAIQVVSLSGKYNPINLQSPLQVREYLYEVQGCPVLARTKTGEPSTDKGTMELLMTSQDASEGAKRFIEPFLMVKKNQTSIAYLDSYYRGQIDWRIYPSINQCGTATTRVSSSNPNGQNISKGVEDEGEQSLVGNEGNGEGTTGRLNKARGVEEEHQTLPITERSSNNYSLRYVFGPSKGTIWFPIDYSQLQLRIFAFASGEQSLIDLFEHGWDYHNFVASKIFHTDHPSSLQRRVAKNVNFALIFGAGRRKVDQTAGMTGAYDLFRSQFPNVDKYMSSVSKQVKQHGYVETLGGYRLWIDRSKPYKGVNYVVQGSEGELVKEAMCDCEDYLHDTLLDHCGSMLFQVHDELIFELPTSLPERIVRKVVGNLSILMERAALKYGIVAPTDADKVVLRWSESVKYLSSTDVEWSGGIGEWVNKRMGE